MQSQKQYRAPLISVVLPVYNGEKYLETCLKSVINQTFSDIEIICVNDGSTDNTIHILEKYATQDSRIKIISQENKGLGAARNEGMKYATGKYLAFIDSDDFYELNVLQKVYSKIAKTNSDITLFNFFRYNEDTNLSEIKDNPIYLKNMPQKPVFSAADCEEKIFQIHFTAVWGGIYRTEFIKKYKIKCANVFRGEDAPFTLAALALAKRISYIPDHLIHYRISNKNSLSNKADLFWEDLFTAYTLTKKFFIKNKIYKKFDKEILDYYLSNIIGFTIGRAREPIRTFVKNKLLKEFILPDQSYFKNRKIDISFAILKNQSYMLDYFKNLFYHKKQKIIPIVYITDRGDLAPLEVSISSLEKKEDCFYDIYILHTALSFEEIFNLQQMSSKRMRITCIDIKYKLSQKIKEPIPTIQAYIALIPELIYGYKKIFYFDTSTFAQSDILPLYAAPMQKNYATVAYSSDKNHIDIGVMLINLSEWEKNSLSEKILNYFYKNKKCSFPEALYSICLSQLTFFDSRQVVCLDNKNFDKENAILCYYRENPWNQTFSQKTYSSWWGKARNSKFYESFWFQDKLRIGIF